MLPTGLGKRCHILLHAKVAHTSQAIYRVCHVDSVTAVEKPEPCLYKFQNRGDIPGCETDAPRAAEVVSATDVCKGLFGNRCVQQNRLCQI